MGRKLLWCAIISQPHGISPTKKDREDMQIISSQPFFHNGFLMVRFRSIGHLERRNLPVWGKDPGSRDSEPRELLPPCALYHGALDFSTPLRFGRNDEVRGIIFII